MMTARRGARYDGAVWDRIQAWALANVESLAADYAGVELRRGRCACPLHGGDNPDAFSVANGKGWHCFTGDCGSGDGVDLVRRLRFAALSEKDGRTAALRELASRVGVWLEDATMRTSNRPVHSRPAPSVRNPDKKAEARTDPRASALAAALEALRADGYLPAPAGEVLATAHAALVLRETGRAVLAARGFAPDAAAAYGFRSLEHPRDWCTLREALEESYLPPEWERAGLFRFPPRVCDRTPDGEHWRDMGPVLVLPYHARLGHVQSFRFRALMDGALGTDAKGRGRRYTSLMDLLGAGCAEPFNAPDLEDLTTADTLHVVEGELNAYAIALTGARVIGIQGATTWRAEWTPAISAAGKLVLWYDNDPAGEKGYTRLVEALLPVLGRSGVRERVRRVRINATEAKDANDLHRLGRLRPLMESAPWMR